MEFPASHSELQIICELNNLGVHLHDNYFYADAATVYNDALCATTQFVELAESNEEKTDTLVAGIAENSKLCG